MATATGDKIKALSLPGKTRRLKKMLPTISPSLIATKPTRSCGSVVVIKLETKLPIDWPSFSFSEAEKTFTKSSITS